VLLNTLNLKINLKMLFFSYVLLKFLRQNFEILCVPVTNWNRKKRKRDYFSVGSLHINNPSNGCTYIYDLVRTMLYIYIYIYILYEYI